MRVMLLDVNCKYSSTGKIVYDLYEQLNEQGHVAAIGYGRGPLVDGENIYRFSPRWEVYAHALLARLTGWNGCFSPLATRNLIRFIEKFQPDVVHLNDMHGYFVNITKLMKYLKEKGIRTVWTFHCEYMYTGKCGHAYECDKWKSVCERCPQVKEYPKSMGWDFTRRMFWKKRDAFDNWNELVIVTPSEWLRQRVKSSFLKRYEVEVIHNGLDTKIFRDVDVDELAEKLGIEEKRVALSVAPNLMSEEKGGRFIVELAKRMPETIFVMIGAKHGDIPVRKNIVDVGVVRDPVTLAKFYSLADAFVLCSKRETFSMTTAEAHCCGTPVVGFKAGAPETIALEPYSRFVEYGDIDGLQSAVEMCLQNNWKVQSQTISELAKKRFSKERMFQDYFRLYSGNEKG